MIVQEIAARYEEKHSTLGRECLLNRNIAVLFVRIA
jgi:hypothetical protein